MDPKEKPRGMVGVGRGVLREARGVARALALVVRRRGVGSGEAASEARRVGVLSEKVDWREAVEGGREGGAEGVSPRVNDRRLEVLLAADMGRDVVRVEL